MTEAYADGAGGWVDPRRGWWALAAVLPLLPAVAIGLTELTGSQLALWLPLAVVYGLVPVLDWMVGEDTANPPPAAVAALAADPWYFRLVCLGIPAVYATVALAAWYAVTRDLAWYGYLGLVFGTGFTGGAAINMGHELGHKKGRLERWLARLALAPHAYGHFVVEHVRGHHRDVATPEDSASARMGESYYRFMGREIPGGFRRAWALESARLARQGRRAWALGNECVRAGLLTAACWGALLAWLGWAALPFLVLQAAFAYTVLSAANYVEHYGLLRERDAQGRYLRPAPRHSWNSNHVLSNILLYQLQRHSDHHAHPTRPYQALRHFEEAPQLPLGYFGMFVLAWLPPLYFRVMDPRVLAQAGGDPKRINRDPRRALAAP